MKNKHYTINGLYGILRDFYLDSFPHASSFNALQVLNSEIKKINKSAKIEESNFRYSFDNPNPTVVDANNPYSNENGSEGRNVEEYFENAGSNEIRNIIQDLYGLESWLGTAGFIENKIATEKLLANKKLI